MPERWYEDGLQFTCTRCGDCCTGKPGYVWVSRGEVEALASLLAMPLPAFGSRYLRKVGRRYSLLEKGNGDCIFYDGGCTVYPARPVQCRTFPFWPENLRSPSAWEEGTSGCPGSGRGRLYSVEEIDRLRRGEGQAGDPTRNGGARSDSRR